MGIIDKDNIRVSLGSAVKLGLKRVKVDTLPTNCHLLTYHPDGCIGNCGFCPQSQYTHDKLSGSTQDQEYLSRVLWPVFDLRFVIQRFQNEFPAFDASIKGFQRICIQSLNYPNFERDIKSIIRKLTAVTNIPLSIAIPPVSIEDVQNFKDLGVDRICFALDAATATLFESVKGSACGGPYSWQEHIRLLRDSVKIFGRGHVTTHLIIGLGETEQEALTLIQEMKYFGILTGLFAFYPIQKTRFAYRTRPKLISFRKVQLGKYLIDTKRFQISDFGVDSEGTVTFFPLSSKRLHEIISLSGPFETSGCPGCNRPYYTSSPREEQYNYPRVLTLSEQEKIYSQLEPYCKEVNL
ncbi:MAG: radical SAM protein [Candidatus Lokiarchaeota archaeon]|nr:radical SAM protein [Candidatus Lokiarchaeota archaeon]